MGRPNTWQGEPTELLLKEGLDHTEQSYYTSTWREASRGWAGVGRGGQGCAGGEGRGRGRRGRGELEGEIQRRGEE